MSENMTKPDPLQEFIDDPFLLAKDVQRILPHLTPKALANIRCRRPGELKYYKIANKTVYRKSDLIAWIESQVEDEGGQRDS